MRMLSDAWFLARSDCSQMLRRRETWMWTFVLPVVFFYFIGTITSQFAGMPEVGDPLEVVIPENGGFLAAELVKRLEQAGYRIVRITDPNTPMRQRRLVIPGGFTQAVQSATPVKLEFVNRDTGAGGDYDQVRLARSAYGLLADFIVLSQGDGKPDGEGIAKLAGEPRLLTLESKAAGKRKVIPSGFEQAVPGSLVFFLLMNLLTVSAVTLVMGREQGILRRLASAPISREGIVLGKWGGRMLLASIQIVFSMVAGSALFHVHWGAHVWMVLIVLFVYSSFATSLGFLIGGLAGTRAQAGAMGSISANVLACIGGCWWPAEIMPRTMQTIAAYTPAGSAMSALHQLVNFGAGPAAALPQTLFLAGCALVAGWLAAKRFRFQ